MRRGLPGGALGVGLCLGLVTGGAPARAQAPERVETGLLDAISPAVGQQVALARQAEAEGALRRAEAAWALVVQHEPAFVPGHLGLGRVREARGDSAGAIAAYQRLPAEPEAVEALARLVSEADPGAAPTSTPASAAWTRVAPAPGWGWPAAAPAPESWTPPWPPWPTGPAWRMARPTPPW